MTFQPLRRQSDLPAHQDKSELSNADSSVRFARARAPREVKNRWAAEKT
jgi:hypothetical protein